MNVRSKKAEKIHMRRLSQASALTRRIKTVIREHLELDQATLMPNSYGENIGLPQYVAEGPGGSVCLSDIARGSGLSLAAISRIFSGNRNPSLFAATAICDYVRAKTKKKFNIEDLMKLIRSRVASQGPGGGGNDNNGEMVA